MAQYAPAVTGGVMSASGRPRVYVIKDGDTIAGIAQQYGLKPASVLAVNPKVNPKRLKVGHTINLP